MFTGLAGSGSPISTVLSQPSGRGPSLLASRSISAVLMASAAAQSDPVFPCLRGLILAFVLAVRHFHFADYLYRTGWPGRAVPGRGKWPCAGSSDLAVRRFIRFGRAPVIRLAVRRFI